METYAMNMMVSNPQWTDQAQTRDPVRQLFDKLFEGSLFAGRDSDDSSVVTSQWAPLVDIVEEPERFVLYADIPGVDPQDIEVQMDRGLLTIKGERRPEMNGDKSRFSRIERLHGGFHRRFALPDSADPEGIQARGHQGVLQVVIPKRPESKPRRIKVGSTH
jgi:HSP20 family protein